MICVSKVFIIDFYVALSKKKLGLIGQKPIHERLISLRFLGITCWKVLRLEVSVYNVNIANQFPTSFSQGGGGGGLKNGNRG